MAVPEIEAVRVLIVNDEEDQIYLIGRKLDSEGLEIYGARTFAEARKIAGVAGPHIAVIDTEVGREWGPNLAEELYMENSKIYVVGTSIEAENGTYWRGLKGLGDCDFQLFLEFDAKKVLEGYRRRRGSTTRKIPVI